MRLSISAASDTGRVRRNNQDAYGMDDRSGLLLVADGMGGHAAGEVASRIAVEVILKQVSQGLETGKIPAVGEVPLHLSDRGRLLLAAVRIANEMVYRSSLESPDRAGMGTTVVAALVRGGKATVAHVGDSRLYLWRKGKLTQWTQDHSLVAEQVQRGLLTKEDAVTALNQNVLTRALGIGDVVDVEIQEYAVRQGDVFLLCSDGLTRMVTDDEIAGVLRELSHPWQMCHNLVRLALDRGGKDNVTVTVGKIEGPLWWTRIKQFWKRQSARRQP